MHTLQNCRVKWLVPALIMLLLPAFAAADTARQAGVTLVELCNEFNGLNSAIRDNRIGKPLAKERVRSVLAKIRSEYRASGGKEHGVEEWVFPLQGYGPRAIGGVRGNGYRRGGYDYFDGNRHTGHPSHDIFIRDSKQRSLDDATGKPVSVLSVSGGVVVAAEKEWAVSSRLRGGKYLWIYDPAADALFYYAHNSTLLVTVGDLVSPGDVIACVGRSGLNAHKRRSPTHLHFTCLSLSEGVPVPVNIYRELVRSRLM
jgi:murein DD-endopeptidase MepM/ murein hydrolase activator NlpD